ncbi:hypothetical protein BKA61DRAFT_617642 [Leptodontidium sp. MPI-SDFR-AT-0119]|nr:hypothetical protein BKA61DRAFT_617642 [Leptodontidium sp. MPI-SDFR-AT-0119]
MEPLTAFGLSLAILNIFLNTIDQMRDRFDWIVNLKQKLEDYQIILVACETSFEIWFRLWDQPGEAEATWKRMFGAKNWILIRNRKQAIRDLLNDVRGSLCLSPAKSRRSWREWIRSPGKKPKHGEGQNGVIAPSNDQDQHDFNTWQDFTKSLEEIESMPEPHPSVIQRILRVLGENQLLGRQIANLKTQVEMLDVVTRNCYKIMGNAELDPMEKSIKQTRDRLKFQALARTLATSTSSPMNSGISPKWFLELHVPEDIKETTAIINNVIENCAMFFSAASRMAVDKAPQTKEIRLIQLKGASIPIPRPSEALATAMSNIQSVPICHAVFDDVVLELRTHSTPLLWSKSWQRLLLADLKDQKALEVERARMALCLTTWLILLWETDWFSHICPCSFRCVIFRNERAEMEEEKEQDPEDVKIGQPTPSPHRQEHVYSAATHSSEAQPQIQAATASIQPPGAVSQADAGQSKPNNVVNTGAAIETRPGEDTCARRSTPKDRLYFLGVFISELFLARPIKIVSTLSVDARNKPIYQHCPNNPSSSPTKRSLNQNPDITYELEYHGPGKAISDAVNFCFAGAYEPEWTSFDQSKSATRTGKLIENVLRPLADTYLEFKKNQKPRFAKELFPAMEKYEDSSFKGGVEQPVDAAGVSQGLTTKVEADTHLPQEVVVQQEAEKDNLGLNVNRKPIIPPDRPDS